MKTSSAKAKGKRCVKDTKALMLHFAPHLKEDDIFIPTGSVPGADMVFSPEARKIYDLGVECKNVESLNIWKAYEQAVTNSGGGEPVVFFKRNNSELLACVTAEFLISLLAIKYDFQYSECKHG
jgi:hypothetical protein